MGIADPVSDCTDSIPESWEFNEDMTGIGLLNPCLEDLPTREYAHAGFSLSRTFQTPARATIRHSAVKGGLRSRIEIRNDTLWRRQLVLESGGWSLLAGDMTDTAMPMLPPWLPRRALPDGWKMAPGEYLPLSSSLEGIGAGVFRNGWKAYAVRSLNPLQSGREPPWAETWDFRHFAAGAETVFPWHVSLHLSETRISRSTLDSVNEHRFEIGLLTPDARLGLHSAWVGGRGPGGFAFGLQGRQPFGDSGAVEIKLRQRDAAWRTVWDPSWANADSNSNSVWGAGEFSASLRLPIPTAIGHAHMEGNIWGAWNPSALARRAGIRGEAVWRGKNASLSTQAVHSGYSSKYGESFYRRLSLQVSAGRNPEWSAKVWITGNGGTNRQGMLWEAEAVMRGFQIRPGIEIESEAGGQPDCAASLWTRLRLGGGWTFEGNAEAPMADFSLHGSRFHLALQYQGKPAH